MENCCLNICRQLLMHLGIEREDCLRDSLLDCDAAFLGLLSRQLQIVIEQRGNCALLQQRCEDLISLSNKKLNAYPFKDVPECWRRLYTDASIVKVCSIALKSVWNNKFEAEAETRGVRAKERIKLAMARTPRPDPFKDCVKEGGQISNNDLDVMVKTLDMAIIISGAPGPERREWIESIMEQLQKVYEDNVISEIPALKSNQRSPGIIKSTLNLDDYDLESRPLKRRRGPLQLPETHIEDEFSRTPTFVPPVIKRPYTFKESQYESFMEAVTRQHSPITGPQPVVMQDATTEWDAVQWKRSSYLMQKTIGGRRMIPVELGRSYVDEGWGQQIIPFREFMNNYILRKKKPSENLLINDNTYSSFQSIKSEALAKGIPTKDRNEQRPSKRTGYLAQHDLFSQIPSLRSDVHIPDLCYELNFPPHKLSPLAAKHAQMPILEEPQLNVWFGPAGTISPLHTDPYHNVLAQVVGRKYVRLYEPGESTKVYPRGIEEGGVQMENTSLLDVGILEGWDGTKVEQDEAHFKYPLYKNAQFVDLILEEGEFLYIPLGWWHYVRSLTISFSVSFWWN